MMARSPVARRVVVPDMTVRRMAVASPVARRMAVASQEARRTAVASQEVRRTVAASQEVRRMAVRLPVPAMVVPSTPVRVGLVVALAPARSDGGDVLVA
jgi:hypothetical protein